MNQKSGFKSMESKANTTKAVNTAAIFVYGESNAIFLNMSIAILLVESRAIFVYKLNAIFV